MSEICCYCEAEFSVLEVNGGSISGACQEPIVCPNCKRTVRRQRTTGVFDETLIKLPDNKLSKYLGISDLEWESMGAELNENRGSSGDMNYSYWFIVPEGTSEEILEKTGWEENQQIIDIPTSVVDFN